MRMPFGKHKGEEVEDLPEEYIRWVLENCTVSTALASEMEAQLGARRGEGIQRRAGRP